MKKILFTGGTGFLGRNLIPILSNEYEVWAPTRQDLDVTNQLELEKYICENYFDVIIHAAIPNIAFNEKDKSESLIINSLIPFYTLVKLQAFYGKLIYFGSGAEFDKTQPIVNVSEEDFGKQIPKSEYGLAKYTMNLLCRQSEKIYNLRIFGCYGPTDAPFKLITHVIHSCLSGSEIRLHQNCVFDFMHVKDLVAVLKYFIENTPKYHDYNVCSGVRTELIEICDVIQNQLGTNLKVVFEKEGYNNEYSGDNKRICTEIGNIFFTSIVDGIKQQIQFERIEMSNEKEGC